MCAVHGTIKEISMFTVAVIVGSLRKDSINKKLARALEKLGSDLFTFVPVEIGDLPLFNQDKENPPPETVLRMKDAVAGADAVLFVTPEYNRSVPGVLKNALDWGSRPYGQNVWAGKPAAMAGSTGGSVGTAVAQSHLRSILGFLGMALTVQPELYFTDKPGLLAEDGGIGEESTQKFLRGFLESFAGWIHKVQ